MNETDAQIIEWLKHRPAGDVIKWHSDHLSPDEPWSASWIDVNIDALEAETGHNWSFTVIPAEEVTSRSALWNIAPEPDIWVHAVMDPHPPHYWYVLEIVVPRGVVLTADQKANIDQAMTAGPDRRYETRGGWTAECVSRALNQWTMTHVGRSDLSFEWDQTAGPSKLLVQAAEIAEAIQNGTAKTYKIGDRIQASDQVMDQLLALPPDEAAEISEAFNHLRPEPE